MCMCWVFVTKSADGPRTLNSRQLFAYDRNHNHPIDGNEHDQNDRDPDDQKVWGQELSE